jgi:hypothetical protein
MFLVHRGRCDRNWSHEGHQEGTAQLLSSVREDVRGTLRPP